MKKKNTSFPQKTEIKHLCMIRIHFPHRLFVLNLAAGHNFTKKYQTCVSSAKKSASFFSGAAGVLPAEESNQSCDKETKRRSNQF